MSLIPSLLQAVVKGQEELCEQRLAGLKAMLAQPSALNLDEFIAAWANYEFDLYETREGKRYLTLMKEGGETPEAQQEIQNVVSASVEFQKAEICLRKNDLVQAEELARHAVQMDPNQAEYIALLAWVESMKDSSAEATQMIGPSPVSTVTAHASSGIDRATSANGFRANAHRLPTRRAVGRRRASRASANAAARASRS